MSKIPRIVRAGNYLQLREARQDKDSLSLYPGVLTHVYVRLDMKDRYECATTTADALSYLRAVAKAATICETIAQSAGGFVLEVQGSTIHIGLVDHEQSPDAVAVFGSAIHTAFSSGIGPVYSAVTGWRITADTGKTLVIPGRGVHGDLSYVSLGNSANRPAKHLYAQLSLPEDKRQLKKYYIGVRVPATGKWMHQPLTQVVDEERTKHYKIAASTRMEEPTIRAAVSLGGVHEVTAMAVPLQSPGGSGAPTAQNPNVFFGWVMRADLDGFTQRVEDCHDNEQALLDLGKKFIGIMDTAAAFVDTHNEYMVQLPWSGDNFTAAVVFDGKSKYDAARAKRLLEQTLDFDDELKASTHFSGFNGWGFGVCGADISRNASGNVFIGSVEFDGRRFLVGAGQGFARTLQAFADLKPDPDQLAVYIEDHAELHPMYQRDFDDAKKSDGTVSSLFKISSQKDLQVRRLEPQTANRSVEVMAAGGVASSISAKPYV